MLKLSFFYVKKMIMRIFCIGAILITLLLSSCNRSHSNSVVDDIPIISLPFQNECANGLEKTSDAFVLEGAENVFLLGRFENSNPNNYLLFRDCNGDIAGPMICVFDSCMALQQKFNVFMTYGCFEDEEIAVTTKYVIEKDLSVTTTETVTYRHWNDDYTESMSDSVYVEVRRAELNKKGLFEVVSTEKKRVK